LKKILVTGGFGFIGTTLIQLLIKDKNNSVHVVDNMSTSPIILDNFLDSLPDKDNLSYEIISIQDYFNSAFLAFLLEILKVKFVGSFLSLTRLLLKK